MINGKWMVTNKLHWTQEKERRAESRATTTNAEQIFCFCHFEEKQNANGEGKVAYSRKKTSKYKLFS